MAIRISNIADVAGSLKEIEQLGLSKDIAINTTSLQSIPDAGTTYTGDEANLLNEIKRLLIELNDNIKKQ